MSNIVDSYLDHLPAGLDRFLIRLMGFHIGEANAISRSDLLREINNSCFNISDRSLRVLINSLRKSGHAICSKGGIQGGYYLASSYEELEDFIQRELHSRAMDLLEQEKSLKSKSLPLLPHDPSFKQISFV